MVGDGRCPIVDTWWQTETGGILITPLPGAIALKPGSATHAVLRRASRRSSMPRARCCEGAASGNLCIADSWPGQMRTVYGDHQRFIDTYFKAYPGKYFTGDGCRRDADGYYWITGRVDDVINVSGHRMGTAEVESALVAHAKVSEAAVVGYPHDIKGQGIYAYVTLMAGEQPSEELRKELVGWVRKEIGPIASPDLIQFAPGLPKTRSGKIMRRILRKIAEDEFGNLGDTSTLADPAVVDDLVNNRQNKRKERDAPSHANARSTSGRAVPRRHRGIAVARRNSAASRRPGSRRPSECRAQSARPRGCHLALLRKAGRSPAAPGGLGAGGRTRAPFMMGFLAGLFAKQPEQIKIATAAKLGRPAQAAVIQGLRLAGRHPEAIAAAKSWDWSAEQMAPITPLRPLGEVKPTQPGSFDIFWAASFATGDEAYVRPIYDYYDTVASTADVDVQDIVAIVTLRARRDRAGLEAIKQKYPDATFRRVVNASSALWSLESNARQHKFVASALDRYVKEKPGSPAIEGLAELRKAVASARPAR